jgi:hypothetical protein
VSTPSRLVNQDLPAESLRIDLTNFSISTPNQSGWYLAYRDSDSLQLAKKGNILDETYAIQAWSFKFTLFSDDEAFVLFISESLKSDTDATRFIESENEVSSVSTKHGICVKFKSIHEDVSASKRTNNPESMLLEVIGISCRNPAAQRKGAYIVYSNRYYAGNQNSSLPSEAERLFNSLKFVKNESS